MKIILRGRVEDVLIVDHTRGILRRRGSSIQIDGAVLHADPEARIFSDEPERVCLALGVPYPDPQVIKI